MSEGITMKKSTPNMFMIAMFAQMFGGTMAGSYLTYFLTGRLLMAPVVMASIMGISRIVDLIIGVASGAIVQKFMSKMGQYRFWLFWGPLAVSIGTTMIFICKPFPDVVKLIAVSVGYILYGGGMSFIQISQNGSLAKIAGPDMETRISLSGKMIQGQNIGTLAASMVTLPLIGMIESGANAGGVKVDGYMVMQCIYTVVSFVGQLSLFFAMKDYDKYIPDFKASGGGASVSLVQMFIGTLKNPQIIIVMLADICRFLGMMVLATMALYFYQYSVGNMNMMSVGMTLQSVLGILLAFVSPNIVKKIGKRNAGIFGGLWAGIGYTCTAFFAGTNPWLYIGMNAVAFAGAALINACGVNFYLDCAEYQLYKTGQDNRTFAMSMFGVAIKLQFVVLGFVSAWILTAIGYDNVADTVANPETIVRYIAGVPAVLYFISSGLMFIYKITEDKAREYATANAQKMAAGGPPA